MRFSSGVQIYSGNKTGSPVITLGSNGNLGIGTTSPVNRLQIVGGNLTFENATDNVRGIDNAYDLEFDKDPDNDNTDAWFRFYTNNTIEQLRINDGDEATILGDGTFSSNGIDYAEAFKITESDLEAGDVVSLSLGQWEYCQKTTPRIRALSAARVLMRKNWQIQPWQYCAMKPAPAAIRQKRNA
jgi:hypothetical protein